MRCPDELELQDLFDHELPVWREKALLKHLAVCPDCRLKVERLRQTVTLLQQAIPPVELSFVEVKRSKKSFLKISVAAAAAVVLVLALSLSAYWTHQSQQAKTWSPESDLMEQYYEIYKENCL